MYIYIYTNTYFNAMNRYSRSRDLFPFIHDFIDFLPYFQDLVPVGQESITLLVKLLMCITNELMHPSAVNFVCHFDVQSLSLVRFSCSFAL